MKTLPEIIIDRSAWTAFYLGRQQLLAVNGTLENRSAPEVKPGPVKSPRDEYDDAIDYLIEHPDEIYVSWENTIDHKAGSLFQFAYPGNLDNPHFRCGCLSMIRGGDYDGPSPEITAEIRADQRIFRDIGDVAGLRGSDLRAALMPFAEWQRRLDREIRGVTS